MNSRSLSRSLELLELKSEVCLNQYSPSFMTHMCDTRGRRVKTHTLWYIRQYFRVQYRVEIGSCDKENAIPMHFPLNIGYQTLPPSRGMACKSSWLSGSCHLNWCDFINDCPGLGDCSWISTQQISSTIQFCAIRRMFLLSIKGQ